MLGHYVLEDGTIKYQCSWAGCKKFANYEHVGLPDLPTPLSMSICENCHIKADVALFNYGFLTVEEFESAYNKREEDMRLTEEMLEDIEELLTEGEQMKACCKCGQVEVALATVEGKEYCVECLNKTILQCEHCNAIVSEDECMCAREYPWNSELRRCVEVDLYFCNYDCACDEGFRTCDYCDDLHNLDEMIYIDGNLYCDSDCATSIGYEQCECCWEWFDEDDVTWYDDYCSYYCDSCAPEPEITSLDLILRYHEEEYDRVIESFPLPVGVASPYSPHSGLEVEFGRNGIDSYEADRFSERFYDYFERTDYLLAKDATVAVECISPVKTFTEHFKAGHYEKIIDMANLENLYSCSDYNCGLHVNMSVPDFTSIQYKEIASKMNRILVKFQPYFMQLSRRLPGKFDWCQIVHKNVGTSKKYEMPSGFWHKDDLMMNAYWEFMKANAHEHRSAINIEHITECEDSRRIEFRLFAGSSNPFDIYASTALANALFALSYYSEPYGIETMSWFDCKEALLKCALNNDRMAYLCLTEYMEKLLGDLSLENLQKKFKDDIR